jgi:hypothetical protein
MPISAFSTRCIISSKKKAVSYENQYIRRDGAPPSSTGQRLQRHPAMMETDGPCVIMREFAGTKNYIQIKNKPPALF